MGKKDKIDYLLTKFSKEIRDENIFPKIECANKDLLWKYIHKEFTEEERKHIKEHLISCSECLETLKFLRMAEQVENEPGEIPEELYRNAKEILQKESIKSYLPSKDVTGIEKKIIFLWDKLKNRITRLASNLDETVNTESLEFQAVRKSCDFSEYFQGLPYRTSIKGHEGQLFLEIDCSSREKYLTLKILFDFVSQTSPVDVRVILYESDRIYSSEHLDSSGQAFFPRIGEGKYTLEFLKKNELLERVEIPIYVMRNEIK